MTDIEEKLRKKKEEEEAMWGEYIEQRKRQRQKEEEELRKLKERQAKRKTQRAEQEKMLVEMKKKQEEQRVREIVCCFQVLKEFECNTLFNMSIEYSLVSQPFPRFPSVGVPWAMI